MLLSLDDNQIGDISAMSGLTNQSYLDLRNTPVDNFSAVEFIERNGGTVYK